MNIPIIIKSVMLLERYQQNKFNNTRKDYQIQLEWITWATRKQVSLAFFDDSSNKKNLLIFSQLDNN